jgi:proteasome lid subunit RPN8/RPN11
MIRIEAEPWQVMVQHARSAFPKECCGVMIGEESDSGARQVKLAVPCRNAYDGDQKDRFLIDPKDQLAADRKARDLGLTVLGFFHSHPNEASYFSATDLKNSWPWYSNIVISIRDGEFQEARSFIANDDQTAAQPEPLEF